MTAAHQQRDLVAPRRKSARASCSRGVGRALLVALAALLPRCSDDTRPERDAAPFEQGAADAPAVVDAGPGEMGLDRGPDAPQKFYCGDSNLERRCYFADGSSCCLAYGEDYCPAGTTTCAHWDPGPQRVPCPDQKICASGYGCYCLKPSNGECPLGYNCAQQCSPSWPACGP